MLGTSYTGTTATHQHNTAAVSQDTNGILTSRVTISFTFRICMMAAASLVYCLVEDKTALT